MNNFTESLPKSGHVNEVCKEWLVREDGALAYKLQSQEINDFYKGNRFRNAVVREDFPTALNEQIKEHEQAEKHAELHRRRVMQQEEHDKRVAKEIAKKLERDLLEQQQRDFLESEMMAKRMQEIYVNLPPPPPPVSRADKSKPPPRPAKASTLQQQHASEPSSISHNGRYHANHTHTNQQPQAQPQTILLQQQHFIQNNSQNNNNNHNNTSGTTAEESAATQQRNKPKPLLVGAESISSMTTFNQFTERSKSARSPTVLTNDNISPTHQAQQQQLEQQQQNNLHRHQHTSSIASAGSASSSSSSSARRNVFEFINNPTSQSPQHSPLSTIAPTVHAHTKSMQHSSVEELIDYSDVADSIRHYDFDSHSTDVPDSSPKHHATSARSNFNKLLSPSHENLLKTDIKFQKLSPEKYDEIVGNAGVATCAKQHNSQQHVDDIELYVDPCDYESLQQIGLPLEELKEMSKKLKQEQKDELLARRLQQLEANDGLTQEERDRMLAIEAQDKELAKMLQEREKAKAKRAKQKARLRKSQQQQKDCGSMTGLHCGPLLPLPQDCMSSSKHHTTNSASSAATKAQAHSPTFEELQELEAYSNPIDVIQRTQNGTLTNGSLSRDSTTNSGKHGKGLTREDDIYTLPVDSCRPGQRPASLHIGPTESVSQNNSMTRSENYSHELQDSLNSHDISPRMNYSKSSSFDQNSSPTPPYMPIQGTRRSNSSDERKKKSKDKCTHQ